MKINKSIFCTASYCDSSTRHGVMSRDGNVVLPVRKPNALVNMLSVFIDIVPDDR